MSHTRAKHPDKLVPGLVVYVSSVYTGIESTSLIVEAIITEEEGRNGYAHCIVSHSDTVFIVHRNWVYPNFDELRDVLYKYALDTIKTQMGIIEMIKETTIARIPRK